MKSFIMVVFVILAMLLIFVGLVTEGVLILILAQLVEIHQTLIEDRE